MRKFLGGLLIAVSLFGACAEDGGDTTSPGASSEATDAPASGATNLASFQVEVADGKVVGGSKREEVAVNSTVRITVMSDVADEIHVHGYDEKMNISAGGTVELTFKADVPGVFLVELEEKELKILELEVR